MNCARCGNETESAGENIPVLSIFNEEDICRSCFEAEVSHPDYEKARDAEDKAIADWNLRGRPVNFSGIGLPEDLAVAK